MWFLIIIDGEYLNSAGEILIDTRCRSQLQKSKSVKTNEKFYMNFNDKLAQNFYEKFAQLFDYFHRLFVMETRGGIT